MKFFAQKKDGWFLGRGYRHFDHPLSFKTAKKFVISPRKVAQHNFHPLLSYTKTVRRFKGFDEKGEGIVDNKERLICYACHKDAQIFAYYAHKLEEKYKSLRIKLGIDNCVLAYRSGKGNNISMANSAFEEIKNRQSCSVMAFDISGFFDNIDHKNLKKNWCRVLEKKELPEDHYNIFRSITHFSRVDLKECLNALNLSETELLGSTKPLCNDEDFHLKICGRHPSYKKLIINNQEPYKNRDESTKWKNFGIPQGTSISALLSNIFMIDFDCAMQELALDLGATYLRYSDDILFICSTSQEDQIKKAVVTNIEKQGAKLKINESKTEIGRFEHSDNGLICSVKKGDKWVPGHIQYLGFYFDGQRKLLRHNTIARFQRKRKYMVRSARRKAKKFRKNKIRSKKLYSDLTTIGKKSMPSYAVRAAKLMKEDAIKKQIKNNVHDLNELIKQENDKLNNL
jgi:hypothetical protein